MKINVRPRVIVFDWDGTLFDSMETKKENAARLFAERFGLAKDVCLRLYGIYSGLPRRELFGYICKEGTGVDLTDAEFHNISNEFTKANLEAYRKLNVSLFAEVRDVLVGLKERGQKLYVSSSAAQEEVDAGVDSVSIRSFFEMVYGSTGTFRKGTGHFSKIEQLEHCRAQDMLFFGDDENDVMLGQEFGVPTWRIVRNGIQTGNSSEQVIHSLREVKDLF